MMLFALGGGGGGGAPLGLKGIGGQIFVSGILFLQWVVMVVMLWVYWWYREHLIRVDTTVEKTAILAKWPAGNINSMPYSGSPTTAYGFGWLLLVIICYSGISFVTFSAMGFTGNIMTDKD